MDTNTIPAPVAKASPDLRAWLATLTDDNEVVELLAAMWRSLPGRLPQPFDAGSVARVLLDHIGDAPTAWESPRLRAARSALMDHAQKIAEPGPRLLREGVALGLVFGGQAVGYLESLISLQQRSPAARQIIDAVATRLACRARQLSLMQRSWLYDDLALARWLSDAQSQPDAVTLASAPLSMPLIFTAQMATFAHLAERGFGGESLHRLVTGVCGHSQGLAAALCIAEHAGGTHLPTRAADFAEFMLLLGLHAHEALALPIQAGAPTPMASIAGLYDSELDRALPSTGLVRSINNGVLRKVVSGKPQALEQFRLALTEDLERRRKAKAKGKLAGRVPALEWNYLEVSAPFHSPLLAANAEATIAAANALGFSVGELALPVVDCHDGALVDGNADLVALLARRILCDTVSWPRAVDALVERGATCLVDLGPSDAVAKLTAAALRGVASSVIAAGTAAGEAQLFDARALPATPTAYSVFEPRLRDGASENRYTRLTGRPPIFMPGMTPTSVDAPIVIAAANAGFVAELAGGGQVTEAMLRRRFDELVVGLQPGQGFVFNALYLDPYLWKLHFGDGLLLRLRAEGYPICGVTISAGIPPCEEAVALLRELFAAGIWLNSLKPGNDRQLQEVLAIADALPEHELVVQIEGGKAGGHHSWEDLDDLLVRHYHALRARPNIVLAVGGGIASAARGTAYLNGTWAKAYGLGPMPVDAIFIATLLMAAKEAKTSPAVKRALVGATGSGEWVLDGQSRGAVTSGRSQLDATIYYLDNAAARTGRLLDAVAGDAAAIVLRRDEIIAALEKTAKPYFGDVEKMTYAAWLERLLSLTAIGRHDPYEDGIWPDASYRRRFQQLLSAAQARLCTEAAEALLQNDRELDDPAGVLQRFIAAYPSSLTTLVHPEDARFFLSVCRQPGKPVNFVPVIDAEVRRWYKADSLWQAHHDGYAADAVLTIPGPVAVAGIASADEPVAAILDRFEQHLVSTLRPAPLLAPRPALEEAFIATAADRATPQAWFDKLAVFAHGPIASALSAREAVLADSKRRLPNPLHTLLAPVVGVRLVLRRDARSVELQAYEADGSLFAQLTGTDEALSAALVCRDQSGKAHALDLSLSVRAGALLFDREQHLAAQMRFYAELMFGQKLTATAPFATAASQKTITREAVIAFAAATGDTSRSLATGVAPLDFCFALAWEAIFSALAGARPDMLGLLHESNSITTGPAWPLAAGDVIAVTARLVGCEENAGNRRLQTRAEIFKNGALAAVVSSRFFVRVAANATQPSSDVREPFVARVAFGEPADREFFAAQPWLEMVDAEAFAAATTLEIDCPVWREARGVAFNATGFASVNGRMIARISYACSDALPAQHPVRQVCHLLAAASDVALLDPIRELGQKNLRAPRELAAYARASGDHNPLHGNAAVARLAGLSCPVVHGMWTASAALHRALHLAADGDATRVRSSETRFIAPLFPGEALTVSVRQIGMRAGGAVLEIDASALRDGALVAVLAGRAEIAPPRTAYAFPGQGIQAPGMGMVGYARSPVARAVWDEAEAVCRTRFGFSLLHIVRDNPRELCIDGRRIAHPQGVLYLTQFTQVAMAVMAVAQVRELGAVQALAPDALFCGHSVGEYSALAAIADTLPLSAVVELVYERGLTMDRLIERDAEGHSLYAMGVIRPHRAGLDEATALALVERVREETGLFLQVVNYNIRDRQYAVTGRVEALTRLADRLAAIQGQVPKQDAAYVAVPGIDVPFHSSLLRDGVPAFRATLARVLSEEIEVERLVGRYIPNLIAKPFSLERAFVEEAARVSESPILAALLADFASASRPSLARTLVIELLAYQFASPVRWIETQAVLFDRATGLERFVEIGVAEAPTVANMARATLSVDGPRALRILNSEGQWAELFGPTAPVEVDPSLLPEPVAAVDEAPAAMETARPMVISGPVVAIADAPYAQRQALWTLLALQTKTTPEQINANETLDELLGGNSARRNQVLADIGAEFGVGAIDRAHEQPLSALVQALEQRAPKYAGPGKYVGAAHTQTIAKIFAAARLDRKDVLQHLASKWQLANGRAASVLDRVALDAREGVSSRGGALSNDPPANLNDRAAALQWLDSAVQRYAKSAGVTLGTIARSTATTAVDSAALSALEARVLGPDGVLAATARQLADSVGLDWRRGDRPAANSDSAEHQRLALYDSEHGAAYAEAITPCFDAKKHVAFTSAWAWVKRDLLALSFRLSAGESIDDHALTQLSRRLDTEAFATAHALADRHEARGENEAAKTLRRLQPVAAGAFAGKTVLVTGAGPNSIALSMVHLLLAGGARVVMTVSRYSPARIAELKRLYQKHATCGAELHVVPCNQASHKDVDALLAWIAEPLLEAAGAGERRLKEAWLPDLLIPFGAVGESADLLGLGERSQALLRVLLTGVERLIARTADVYCSHALPGRRCTVLLPLSPNHGVFGGDGAYAESKAALEVLLHKWHSEQNAWGSRIGLVGARIGWVRGTGLMEQNDLLAAELERDAGIRTYTTDEMAGLLAALCSAELAKSTVSEPSIADLTGGFAKVGDLAKRAATIRQKLTSEAQRTRRLRALEQALREALQGVQSPAARVQAQALPALRVPVPSASALASLPLLDHLDLDRVVVVCGFGEVGPWGSSRTRWQIEKASTLSLEAAIELAWMMGYIRPAEAGFGWVDAESGESVPVDQVLATYEPKIKANAGIRLIDPALQGFDPELARCFIDAHLDHDFVFAVQNRAAAEEIHSADPEHTKILCDADDHWSVLRKKGAIVRVPRALRLDRQVAAQIPSGWDATRYGLPQGLVEQVDRVTLFNLIATVEAFLSCGIEPEELYAHLHPSRVGSTQSSGFGGMAKLRRMYSDFATGETRQNDTLQETLINVITGYVVQNYVGSYGPMSFPVAACASAAVSVSDALDKIATGQADLVLAGGVDDYSFEGAVGFGDMNATASSDGLQALGIEPARMSRPNDRRRRGFVEGQGAGTQILARASLAVRLGLPVYGIIAHASAHGDGINLSVPAPGIGVLSVAAESGEHAPREACDFSGRRAQTLAIAAEQKKLATLFGEAEAARMIADARTRFAHDFARNDARVSPLRAALAVFGLGPDDIAVVSKHDTSTTMNDLNENRVHHLLQEKLGRTPHLPLPVISQKSLTGHGKGAAAAWQLNGVLQAMAEGVIPGNASLDDVDDEMRAFAPLTFSDSALETPPADLRAALITSLGFGHVGALLCVVHPFFFWRMLSDAQRSQYAEQSSARITAANQRLRSVLSGHTPLISRRTHRPFANRDGSAAQIAEDAAMLTNAEARLHEGPFSQEPS